MHKGLYALGLAAIGTLAMSTDLVAAARPELVALAAGMRVPAGAGWLVGPMVLAVAGAVTLGWRRAVSQGDAGLKDQ